MFRRLFTKKQKLSDKALRWNKFINEVCSRDYSELSRIQKDAVLCFLYDAEINSGGHSAYFDCYKEVNIDELVRALNTVAYKEISDNFLQALNAGEKNGWIDEDNRYYEFSPSLSKFQFISFSYNLI